jgi:hypothetical protein
VRRSKTNFRFCRKIGNSKSQMGTTKAAQITCRLLYLYAQLTLPLTLPLTLAVQNTPGASPILAFELRYAQMQHSALGLPVSFFHFVHVNYFRPFLPSKLIA